MACKLFQLTFCLLLLTATAAYAEDAQKVGVVGSLKGTLTGTLEGSSTALPLKESDAIYLNETMRTGEDGAAQLMFLDKSSLTLTPSTEVKIDTFVYNPKTSAGKMSLQGAKGAFRFIGGALSKNEPVVIKTPVSTIGIRGGIVQTSISDGGQKAEAIFLYGHEMTVANASGAASSTITQFGHGALMSAAGGIQAMKPAEVGAQLHGFNSSAQSGVSTDQKTNTGKSPSATSAQSTKNSSSGTTSSSNSSASSASSSSSDTSSGSASDSGNSSGTSSASSSTTDTSAASDSAAPTSNPPVGANITSAIPPPNTYNSSSNTITIPAVSDSSLDSWGAWAQAINTDQSTYPSASLDTIISSVTSLPSLGSDLTKLPTSFGTVSYNGTANGSITSGASTAAATGIFSANINFNTQQLTSLSINSFMNGLGYFSANYSGSAQQINNVSLNVSGPGGSGSGTANLAVYGNAAEVLGGKFTATSPTASAQGVLVGHQ